MSARRRVRASWILALAALVAACGTTVTPLPSSTVAPSTAPTKTTGWPGATPSPTAVPSATPTPSAQPASIPIVPVAGFETMAASIDRAGIAAVLEGSNKTFTTLEIVSADAPAILAALGLDGSAGNRLLTFADSATLSADLYAKPAGLGLLRASDVGPSVRALAYDGRSLFGVGRVQELADWPLMAVLPATNAVFDPASTWTVAAAGDVMLDRGVYKTVKLDGKGVDFPFNGGSASITGRTCCSTFGWKVPTYKRVDRTPLVRQLLSGADLAMVNLEGPAPNRSTYHTEGTMFSFDQSLLAGLKYAGIDEVSLANNHIGNAGRAGITQTIAALDRLGIGHAGAGANQTAARQPLMRTVDGVKVALLAYDSIASVYGATADVAGDAQLSWGTFPADIRAARAAGAQVVIVYPHWGREYNTAPTVQERTWAHQMIDAGADLVIGNHAHWAAAMEVYKGKPIWYALGNFVFDQTWSEETMEGIVLELTFDGSRLVQVWLHPLLILDKAQPNFLDPAGSGKIVMDRVFNASTKLMSR